MKSTAGFSSVIVALTIGILLVVGGFLYLKNSKTETLPSPAPAASVRPSPSIETSASPSATPATPSPSAKIQAAPVKTGFYLERATVDYGQERRLLTLTGGNFGQNFNRVIFDDDVSKFKDYGLYNWFNNKIELFLPKEMPDNQTFKVSVLRQDGSKSNTITFQTKQWDKSANSKIDCKTPTNFKGEALSSTEIRLTWDTDPSVSRFQVLQAFNNGSGQWMWLYPRSITTFEGMPNGSVTIKDLTANTANYFSVTVWCNNAYASKESETLTVNTKP